MLGIKMLYTNQPPPTFVRYDTLWHICHSTKTVRQKGALVCLERNMMLYDMSRPTLGIGVHHMYRYSCGGLQIDAEMRRREEMRKGCRGTCTFSHAK